MACLVSGEDWLSPPTEKSMAESVTRHALIPPCEEFTLLSARVDSLDLGLYVDFGVQWGLLRESLQNLKEQTSGKNGLLDQTPMGRTFLHLPSGKAPNYRYHLQFSEYHLYIAITHPPRNSPNVYVSLNSEAIWQLGVFRSVDLVLADLRSFKGSALKIQASRVDLCADFHLPGGLTFDFIRQHKVSRSRAFTQHGTGDDLETYYVGGRKAPILLRIYDKGKEVLKKGQKLWLAEEWGRDDFKDIWRVEFQIRRPALKQFQIDTLDDLMRKAGGMWSYLTGEWCSFRRPDNEKQDRRSLLPWWEEVQRVAKLLGPSMTIQRTLDSNLLASVDWYVSHLAGCLPSLAARLGLSDINEAMNRLTNEVYQYWFERDFAVEYKKRSIKIGRNVDGQGGEDGQK